MKIRYMIAASAICVSTFAANAAAQDTNAVVVAPVEQKVVAVIEQPQESSVLRSGTEIPVTLSEELTTKKKKLKIGHRFRMEVATDISVNGIVVIPAGTPVTGEVTEVRNKGMWGKSGYIGARINSLTLNGRTVRLSGSFDDKGVAGTAGVVGALVVIPIAGFFVTGTSAEIPVGTPLKAFLEEDIYFKTVAAQQDVMEIPVSQAIPAQ